MKRRLIGVLLAVFLALGIAVPALAATTADVTITFTLQDVSMTNDTGSWTMGTILTSSTYWWTNDGNVPSPSPFEAADMKATITNTGNVAEDFDIKGTDSTGGAGMTLSADDTPGASEFSIRAGITGTANEAGMLQVITTDTEIKDNVASSGSFKWCMEMETGTSGPTNAQTATITLTARAHS